MNAGPSGSPSSNIATISTVANTTEVSGDAQIRSSMRCRRSTADNAMETANRIEPLGSLAAETSGQLLKDAGTRLDSALSTLLPDDGEYYLIGFEPAPREMGDSAYRRMKVQVTRPGARVIARTGYALGAAPTPADGPSFGIEPAGTWICTSVSL